MAQMIRFYPLTNEVSAWNVHTQSWTGRVSAVAVFRDDRLMATLDESERLRVARMAAKRGNKAAAYWWAQHAATRADRMASRQYQEG